LAVPWIRVLNGVIGVTDVVRQVRGRIDAGGSGGEQQQLAAGGPVAGALEARLAGVVVAALKEAFDRDHQRLELEREQLAAERERADRALRLELFRQAGDREVGRLRLLAAVAVVSWLGTLFFATRLAGGPPSARVSLGLGWLLLIAALASAFSAQTRVGRALGRIDQQTDPTEALSSVSGDLAPWLIVAGLAVIAFGALLA
jgi:hypothetical protein